MASVGWRFDNRAAVDRRVKDACADAVLAGVEDILGEATKLVPWAEGTLSDSGDTDVDRDGLTGSVYYGGEASAYCVKQHEDTELVHLNGRVSKWLETAFRESVPRIRAKMAGIIRGAM
jgi:hypothetical protein